MKNNIYEISNLVLLVSEGNQRAFTELFNLYYANLYRFVRYFLSETDAEDIVSEVFVSLWNNRKKLVLVNNFNSYIYAMARNEAYAYLRLQNKIQNVSLDDMPVSLSICEESAEGRIIEKEMIEVYNKAVAQLPERCKLIFLMVREEKLKYKEIADVLQITTGTVEQQMNQAIKRISATIEQAYPDFVSKGEGRRRFLIV
ncbi:MAG TPA: RNA polymerase [Porphyromonadaceae bacterium]|nr:RNA polymerase [Porphyromonadaceae bacterium]